MSNDEVSMLSKQGEKEQKERRRNNISSMNTTLCYMYMIEDAATGRILAQ